ncbi:hypothetical protein ACROYT_G039561 [Oculina patagonica]
MYIELLKGFIITVAVQVVLHTVQLGALCPNDNCLTGGFFFAPGRNMVNNHALRGHVFDNFTVKQPIECFRKCHSECRCISFNYLTNVNENNCELNEENRYTNSSALKSLEGSQYYDLTINYNIRANVPSAECQNGCCGSQPCVKKGTCHETCDVMGKRFTCSCPPHFTRRFCETAICSTPDWLQFNGSCFKAFTEKVNWFEAQQTCRSQNSNLTSIHSAEENEFVRDKVATPSERVWIGLNNLINNAVLKWIDGSYVSFTNWASTEPNNSGGFENCTEIWTNGEWNDIDCSYNWSYVCGKEWKP